MSLTVSVKEYSDLEKKHLRVTSEMYSDIQKLRERVGEYTQHNLELMGDLDDAKTRIKVWKHSAEDIQKKFDQIKYLWQMIGLEEGDFVLPDDAAIMRQIDEAFQTSIDSASLRRDQE